MMTPTELTQNEKKLQADEQKLGFLRDANNRAKAAHDDAHGLDDRLQNNVDAGLKVSDKEKSLARAAHASAHDALAKTSADLAAHVGAIGDLGVRARALGEERVLLDQERLNAAYYEAADKFLARLAPLVPADAELRSIWTEASSRWPEAAATTDGRRIEQAAGITPAMFPSGVLAPTQTSIGMRSILQGVLAAFVVGGYSDLVQKHFPDEAKRISERLEAERTNGIFCAPGRADRWEVLAGALGGISAEHMRNFVVLAHRREQGF